MSDKPLPQLFRLIAAGNAMERAAFRLLHAGPLSMQEPAEALEAARIAWAEALAGVRPDEPG